MDLAQERELLHDSRFTFMKREVCHPRSLSANGFPKIFAEGGAGEGGGRPFGNVEDVRKCTKMRNRRKCGNVCKKCEILENL